METQKKEPIAYIYRESFIQSVLSDTYTFGVLFAVMAGNHFLLGNNKLSYFILMFMTIVFIFAKASTKKYTIYSKEDLKKIFK